LQQNTFRIIKGVKIRLRPGRWGSLQC